MMLTDDERRTLEVLEAVQRGVLPDRPGTAQRIVDEWRMRRIDCNVNDHPVLTPAGRSELNRLRQKESEASDE